MPDYLVIDVTGNRDLGSGGIIVRNAASETEAVASLLTGRHAYTYEQEFAVFRLAQRTRIKVEQARTVKQLDAQNPLTVLATYDEAALAALEAARNPGP